ncbi:hypothetical protein CLOP_g1845 [Closterium sp. NIES-67]|nr:hypothetical protein CLOP_g1845 [Closterium sp. NIES-67]
MALYVANLCLLPPFLALPSLLQHHSTTLAHLRDDGGGDGSGDESCRTGDGSRCDDSGAQAMITNPMKNPLMVPMLEREPVMAHTIEYPQVKGATEKRGRRVRWGDEAGFSLTAIREYEPSETRHPDDVAWWEIEEADDDVCNCAMQ